MRKQVLAISTAVLAATLGTSVFGADQSSSAGSSSQDNQQQSGQAASSSSSGSQQQQAQQGQQQQKAPEGWVMLDERVVYMLANEPQAHLTRARAFLDQKKDKAAAQEVQLAASYLDMQASRQGDQQATQKLKQAGDNLRQLADRIQQGGAQNQAVTPEQFDKEAGQAYVALADFHQQMAQRELQQQKGIKAGHDLDAACRDLRQAVAVSGKPADQKCQQAVAQCSQLSMQLLNPTGQQQGSQQQASATGQQQQQSSQADQAQQAGYRSANSQEDLNQTSTNIPQNANQDVQQLGQAIDGVRSTIGSSSSSGAGASSGSGANGSSSSSAQSR